MARRVVCRQVGEGETPEAFRLISLRGAIRGLVQLDGFFQIVIGDGMLAQGDVFVGRPLIYASFARNISIAYPRHSGNIESSRMKLEITPVQGLLLSDPFMIASSHWTSTELAFRQLAPIRPAAVTLKTTSEKQGGDGKAPRGRAREIRDVNTSFGYGFAKYTDGPKHLELWDFTTTCEMTRKARALLPPTTKLGLSVLQGEDYQKARATLGTDSYDYVELNWKYVFRTVESKTARSQIKHIEDDLSCFLKCFSNLPRLIKMPRESIPFISTEPFARCLSSLSAENAALIVANSKRIRVPPSSVDAKEPRELSTGVIVGDYLFLETFNTLREVTDTDAYRDKPFGLIATGGVMDLGGILDLFAAGAKAVQLCTALDVRGLQVVELLREQLLKLIEKHANLSAFLEEVAGSNQKWFSAVSETRKIAVLDAESIEKHIRDQKVLTPILTEALVNELSESPVIKHSKRGPSIDPAFKFIVNHANVGAFLLAVECLEKHRMHRVDVDGASEFVARLNDSSFEYDFVILPKSAIHTIHSLSKPANHSITDKRPVAIHAIGRSLWEIAGDIRFQGELRTIYHFGGKTSRKALAEYLSTLGSRKPELSHIDPPKLL